jgi:eukaryotic-like serine/threonine-protein kinase
LGDGLVDSLAGKLSNLDHANSSLWVVPASEVRNRNVNDPSSALREFGATIAVKGRFSRNGNNVHLNLTLIDTKNMRELGFATAENQTGDLAALEDDVVKQLGRVMNLSVRDETTQNVGRPIAPSIYEDYILAIGYIQRFDKPGNVEHAISALQKAVATDPKFALGFARLAQVYVLKYQLDRNPRWLALAQEYCKHALELDNRVPLAHVALAQVQQRTGHHDLAIEEFQHAIDLDPRDTDALVGIASVYLDLGRNADAETAYLKAAALRPDDWSGYNALGIFYDQIGRHEDAIRQFRHAIELTPDNSALYANLGSAYLNSGDRTLFKAAEDALTKSASMNPDYATYANLGSLYEIQHRFDDSIAACQKALSLNDQSYDVWNTLTAAYEWKGENQKAITSRKKALDLLEQRIRLNPQDQDAMATLAALVAKNGQKDKALQAIQTALALSPESAYVLAEAADVYELLGDRQRAIGYLNQALVHGLAADQLSGDPELQGVITDPHFPKGRT